MTVVRATRMSSGVCPVAARLRRTLRREGKTAGSMNNMRNYAPKASATNLLCDTPKLLILQNTILSSFGMVEKFMSLIVFIQRFNNVTI